MNNKIPDGICQCGCGLRTSISRQNVASRGVVKGQYRKYYYRHKARDNNPERFWNKVDIKSAEECWNWTGCKLPTGYGEYVLNGKNRIAHRVSYEITNGAIPSGMNVCHRCDNTSCVNPSHLFVGTRQDNVDDRVRKGRNANTKGERNGKAKLSARDVKYIRRNYGKESVSGMAIRFGVNRGQIWRVATNKHWR